MNWKEKKKKKTRSRRIVDRIFEYSLFREWNCEREIEIFEWVEFISLLNKINLFLKIFLELKNLYRFFSFLFLILQSTQIFVNN